MKVLMLNGSPHKEGCTWRALCEIAKELEFFTLADSRYGAAWAAEPVAHWENVSMMRIW